MNHCEHGARLDHGCQQCREWEARWIAETVADLTAGLNRALAVQVLCPPVRAGTWSAGDPEPAGDVWIVHDRDGGGWVRCEEDHLARGWRYVDVPADSPKRWAWHDVVEQWGPVVDSTHDREYSALRLRMVAS